MPGICGFLSASDVHQAASLLDEMLAAIGAGQLPVVERRIAADGRAAVGCASLGVLSQARPLSVSVDGKRLAVVDGELYDMEPLVVRCRSLGIELASDDFATAMLAVFSAAGPAACAALEGSFAAAILDLDTAQLTLVSDAFGTRPIYYAQSGDRLLFGSRIAAVLADAELPTTLNWRGISQFFTFGHYFNDDTSLAAVSILPAGSTLTFDAKSQSLDLKRHWAGAARIGQRAGDRKSAFAAIDDTFLDAVRKRSRPAQSRLGLALSGGLDARTILGVFERPNENLQTVCLGMAGSRDHKASSELAAVAGCAHHSHLLDAAFLNDFGRHLNDMVRLTDGQYLSQCIVMPTFSLYQQLGVGVLLRGHGGELMHMSKAYNYSLDAGSFAIHDQSQLEDWLWRRLQAYLLDGVEGPLFVRPEAERIEAARASLRSAIAATPADEPPSQRISHLFLDQRLRRETALSLMKFRSVVEPRMPYMDRALVEQLLGLPIEWKLDDELQTFILQHHRPRFCHVENTNTGSVLRAGKLRRSAAGLRMKVLSKLGMPGYQPYERLGLWLRRELAPLVRQVLLDEACLDRGVFAPDTVRAVVDRHLAGSRNHTYLIMAMMVFEVGHRALLGDQSWSSETIPARLPA